MIRKNKSTKVLSGVYALPTSSKAHVHEPKRGTAFVQGCFMYLLTATQSIDEGGYPAQVVMSSNEEILDGDGNPWTVDQEVQTQHAQVRKNLPPRAVAAIINPEGEVDGSLVSAPKGLGLPHWEFISTNADGSANLADCNAVEARIKANKDAMKADKEAVRDAKKGSAKTA